MGLALIVRSPSRLDAAVEGLKRVQANLKRYRASVLKAAVEGRLVPTEAALAKAEGRTYEPASALLARILTERRKRWEEAELAAMKTKGTVPKDDKWKAKYQEPSPPDTKGLPELPEGWCWASVDALILGSPQNGLYLPQSEYGAGVPILRIDDFQSMTATPIAGLRCVKVDDNTASKYRLAVGDVIVNRVNSLSHLGKSVAVGAALDGALFESNMMRFTCVDPSMSRYVEVYLASDVGKARLVTNAKWAVNQASINQRDVLTTVIPLPPLREQLRVLAQVSLLLTAQGHEKSASEHAIARCSRLRQSILKWAFEGKLVDQDPNDEPASVLLERIRAERQVHTATKARNGTPPPTAPRNTDSAAASKRRTRQKARPEAARRVP
jgi:type I restriction enzyme S subunit